MLYQLSYPGTASMWLADPTGLEPATSGLTGRRANQLRYGSALAAFTTVGETGLEPVTTCV